MHMLCWWWCVSLAHRDTTHRRPQGSHTANNTPKVSVESLCVGHPTRCVCSRALSLGVGPESWESVESRTLKLLCPAGVPSCLAPGERPGDRPLMFYVCRLCNSWTWLHALLPIGSCVHACTSFVIPSSLYVVHVLALCLPLAPASPCFLSDVHDHKRCPAFLSVFPCFDLMFITLPLPCFDLMFITPLRLTLPSFLPLVLALPSLDMMFIASPSPCLPCCPCVIMCVCVCVHVCMHARVRSISCVCMMLQFYSCTHLGSRLM